MSVLQHTLRLCFLPEVPQMSDGQSLVKRKARLADMDDGFPEHFVAAYLIVYDRQTKMYRAYHADMEDLVVMDDDPIAALEALIDIISMEVNHEDDDRYN